MFRPYRRSRKVRWYVVLDASNLPSLGANTEGFWTPVGNRIVIAGRWQNDGELSATHKVHAMSRPSVLTIMSACVLLSPIRIAAAQDHLSVLALPPASVGTCLPLQPDAGSSLSASPHTTAHRLVMVSNVPGTRREIVAYADSAGQPLRYAEMVSDFVAPAGGKGVELFASLTRAGVVRGWITRREVTMTPPAAGARIDSTAMRAMRESAKTKRARTALDASQQRKVLTLARWLVRRCPAG